MKVTEKRKVIVALDREEQKTLKSAANIIYKICEQINPDECPIFESGLEETACPFYGLCPYQTKFVLSEKFKTSWESSLFHETQDIKIEFE